jgi:hypothetical protein
MHTDGASPPRDARTETLLSTRAPFSTQIAPEPPPEKESPTTAGETATQSGLHGIGVLPSRQDAPAGASKRTRHLGKVGSGVGVGVGVARGVGDGVGDGFGYETSEILRYHHPL